MNNGISLIQRARELQLQPRPVSDLVQRGASIGADVAGLIDELLQLQQPADSAGIVDLLNPKFVRLNNDGAELPDRDDADSAHIATLYPQFGLIVDIRHPEDTFDWDAANEKAKATAICGAPSDGLLFGAEWALVIDRRKPSPMVNRKAFPNPRTDRIYWAADPHPSGSGCAYCVDLGSGGVGWGNRSDRGLAVACRRVSPRQ